MSDTSSFQNFSCSANDGLVLGGRLYGAQNSSENAVVCLPGLSRNCSDFHNLAVHLTSIEGGAHRVLALDLRGRGLSQRDENWQNYNIFQEADDTIAAITAAGLRHVHIVGTSRGGLITMLLGCMRPGIIKSVILNDIGPVLEGRGLLRIRNALEKHRNPKSWEEAEEEFVRIGRLQFPALSEQQWREEAHRIFAMEDGKLEPRYDRKIIKPLKNVDFDERLPSMWPQFASLSKLPMMTIRGEHSDLLSQETLDAMSALKPDMQIELIDGQGHAPRIGTAGLPQKISTFFSRIKAKKGS